MTMIDSPGLEVLGLGRRDDAPPAPREICGLRLADGGALPGVVLHAYDTGLYAGARVLWIFDRWQQADAVGATSLTNARPLLAPLIVHREVWTSGCAFRTGHLAPEHPALRKRVVVTDTFRKTAYDLADRQVEPRRGDVVARNNLVFLKGLDKRLGRLVTRGAG
jgi:hypothetical protein